MTDSTADPDDLYDVANQLKEDGNLEAAVEALKNIVADFPDHVQSHLALGVHLQKLGQNEAAVAHASKVAKLEPQDAFSYVQLSVVMQRCGLIMEAEDAMARAHAIRAEQSSPE
ncbi:MAG: tetratricopeptide repeat protein [Fuerstiella sp.]|nr:tetratricopeptide repeat protein [Fuerstiella sp.]